MYFVVFFSILAVVSGLPTPPIKAGPTVPRPCCSPEQYTHGLGFNSASVQNGKLLAEFGESRGAYDFVNKLLGAEVVVDFTNGTEDLIKIILDFNKFKGYYITNVKGVVSCEKFEIPEVTFPENCLPDDAKFVSSTTVGDRALVSDQWYISRTYSNNETAHIVYSIKEEGCVDLGSFQRVFDSNTDAEIRSENTQWFDFELGIDDPARWFKPPSECKGAKVTKVPPQLRNSPMYGGKVTLFD